MSTPRPIAANRLNSQRLAGPRSVAGKSASPYQLLAFWSRWHMMLSRWIRDYLFFPVTVRFRDSPAALYVSLLAVMALVGLWHGAGWGFVAWGVMHGAYLVLYRMWESLGAAVTRSRVAGWGWRIFTLVVTAAWVPFRAATGADAAHMLAGMFGRFRFGYSYPVDLTWWCW